MKRTLHFSKATLITLLLLCGMSYASMAATFTASTSGNWSSSTTWGVTGPGFNITSADAIIIPLGVTVTLDNDLTVNNASASISVAGTLTGLTQNLTLTAGTLSGAGAVAVNNLTVGAAGYITSVGTIAATQFTNSQAALTLTATLAVSNTIALTSGVVSINTGGIANLANNVTINMAGGAFTIAGGALNLAGNYNLLYSGTVSAVGLEASLVGLQNVTVNLASPSSTLTLAGNLAVAGTLSLQQGVLTLNGNSLTLNGGINTASTGSIAADASSNIIVNGTGSIGTMGFASGSQTLNNLTLNIAGSGSISLSSNATVSGALSLSNGSLSLNGHNLTLNGTIAAVGTGSITGSGTSNITVNGTGAVGTLMFSPSGNTLGGLTVNIGAAGSVLLGSNLTVAGTIALSSGTLNLNAQSLTIGGTVTTTGTGSITGNMNSNITLNGAGNAGTLVFAALGNTINNLTMNIGSSGAVALGSDLTVNGALTLAQGIITLGSSTLTIPVTGSLTGGSAVSYVATTGTGTLAMTVAGLGAAGMFQVGTAAHYAAVNVTNNSALAGTFNVLAHPGIFANGTTGADLSATQSGVNTSWDVTSSIVAAANVNLEMYWNSSMQVNGFNNAQAFISHYTAGAWNTSTAAAATSHGGGNFSLMLTGITSFSPFAAFDNNTLTSIADISTDATFSIYPNPATNYLNVSVKETGSNPTLKIYDAIGNEVVFAEISSKMTSVDISNFAPGIYFASLNNTATKRFIKK